MKCYVLTRKADGTLQLLCQALVKGKLIEETFSGGLDIGNSSSQTKALALAIADHYFVASPSDPAAKAEAERQAEKIQHAFLTHHVMPKNSTYEVSSEVIDRLLSLQ